MLEDERKTSNNQARIAGTSQTGRIWTLPPLRRAAQGVVAQIFNLLYRRIVFGRAWPLLMRVGAWTPGGLQVRDTAECNSALRWQCPDAPSQTHQHPTPNI